MNSTLTYQLTDPRTAAEFAPCWDKATKNWTSSKKFQYYCTLPLYCADLKSAARAYQPPALRDTAAKSAS